MSSNSERMMEPCNAIVFQSGRRTGGVGGGGQDGTGAGVGLLMAVVEASCLLSLLLTGTIDSFVCLLAILAALLASSDILCFPLLKTFASIDRVAQEMEDV